MAWKDDVRALGFSVSDRISYDGEAVSELDKVLREYHEGVIAEDVAKRCVGALLLSAEHYKLEE